jgi:predicted DNA-binding WGR domain protein
MGMMYLERRDIARNMARYYCLTVERNLFGEFSLVRTWGRIGHHGRQKIELYNTLDAAQASLHWKVRQKHRRGYYDHTSN